MGPEDRRDCECRVIFRVVGSGLPMRTTRHQVSSSSMRARATGSGAAAAAGLRRVGAGASSGSETTVAGAAGVLAWAAFWRRGSGLRLGAFLSVARGLPVACLCEAGVFFMGEAVGGCGGFPAAAPVARPPRRRSCRSESSGPRASRVRRMKRSSFFPGAVPLGRECQALCGRVCECPACRLRRAATRSAGAGKRLLASASGALLEFLSILWMVSSS